MICYRLVYCQFPSCDGVLVPSISVVTVADWRCDCAGNEQRLRG